MPTQIRTTDFSTKVQRQFNGGRKVFSINELDICKQKKNEP